MSLKKIYYRKLVRDKIPEIITAVGDTYKVKILEEEEFKTALFKKLQEETKELQKTDNQHIGAELSDLLEIIETIAKLNNISWTDLRRTQKARRKKRGGFTKKLLLIWSTWQK